MKKFANIALTTLVATTALVATARGAQAVAFGNANGGADVVLESSASQVNDRAEWLLSQPQGRQMIQAVCQMGSVANQYGASVTAKLYQTPNMTRTEMVATQQAMKTVCPFVF